MCGGGVLEERLIEADKTFQETGRKRGSGRGSPLVLGLTTKYDHTFKGIIITSTTRSVTHTVY